MQDAQSIAEMIEAGTWKHRQVIGALSTQSAPKGRVINAMAGDISAAINLVPAGFSWCLSRPSASSTEVLCEITSPTGEKYSVVVKKTPARAIVAAVVRAAEACQ